jgi:hypothetical protein
MTRITKNLLALSVAGFVIGMAFVTGIIDVSNAVALYVALPLGAVFFGLFLIFRMLEKESSQYDDAQQTHPAFKQAAAKPAKAKDCGCGCSAQEHRAASATR